MTSPADLQREPMNATEVREAIERCKQLLTLDEWKKLSHEQKAYLCQVVNASDDVDVLLAFQSLEHPLTAKIKKHRGTFFKRKFYLDGVLAKNPVNHFETKEQAQQFAQIRGIALCEQ